MTLVKLAWDAAADQSILRPRYESAAAAGADLRANFPPELRDTGVTLDPGARALIPTGLRMEILMGFEVQIRGRSGLALKHGVGLANGVGTIDADYRGAVGVILINLGDAAFHVAHGDRIAQLVAAPIVQAQFDVVDVLDETARGAGGFGSTGVSE